MQHYHFIISTPLTSKTIETQILITPLPESAAIHRVLVVKMPVACFQDQGAMFFRQAKELLLNRGLFQNEFDY